MVTKQGSHPWQLVAGLTGISMLILTACSPSGAEQAEGVPNTATEQDSVNEELRELLPEDILDAGEIVVGSPYSSAPLIFVDGSGSPTGAAYDISQELGEVLGVDFSWEELAFTGVVPGLQAGNFDVSMGVIGATPERQEILDMVMLYKNESALLTQKGNPHGVTDLEDACGLTIGGLAGSHQIAKVESFSDECVAQGDQPITINEYSNQSDSQAAVQSDRVAAFVAPYLTLNHVAMTAGNGEIFELGTGLYPDNPFAIAMQKDRGELSEAIRGALEVLVENGTYEEILEEYDSTFAALSEEQIVINGAGTELFDN